MVFISMLSQLKQLSVHSLCAWYFSSLYFNAILSLLSWLNSRSVGHIFLSIYDPPFLISVSLPGQPLFEILPPSTNIPSHNSMRCNTHNYWVYILPTIWECGTGEISVKDLTDFKYNYWHFLDHKSFHMYSVYTVDLFLLFSCGRHCPLLLKLVLFLQSTCYTERYF